MLINPAIRQHALDVAQAGFELTIAIQCIDIERADVAAVEFDPAEEATKPIDIAYKAIAQIMIADRSVRLARRRISEQIEPNITLFAIIAVARQAIEPTSQFFRGQEDRQLITAIDAEQRLPSFPPFEPARRHEFLDIEG